MEEPPKPKILLSPDEEAFRQEHKEPFLRNEMHGHLWNDWLGKAQSLKYLLEPQKRGYDDPQKLKEIQGQFLYDLIRGIYLRPDIPKIDIEAMPAVQKEGAKRYNELAKMAMSLYKQIEESVNNINLIQEKNEFNESYSGRLEIPVDHPVLQLASELKKIMIEVNELLYNKPCQFFD